jgi:hypothetical protein
MRRRHAIVPAFLLALLLPGAARAGVRIVAVVPLDGGCVSAPAAPSSRTWDVQPGANYRVTVDQLGECEDEDGRRASLTLMLANPTAGNQVVTVQRQADGSFAFDFSAPAAACDTYRVPGCQLGDHTDHRWRPGPTGIPALAGLRMVGFTGGCAASTPVSCVTPALARTWGALKTIYR